jgi:SAM-dependent methyltransferase
VSTFDERAGDWDTPERRARADEAARAIRANVTLAPTDRVVDIGAGTGLVGLALAGDIGELVLAEPSDGMLAVIAEKLGAGDRPRVSAVKFDLLADRPPGDPFDLAVSFLVLHHIDDTAAALTAIRALLRPGGRMAVADLDTEDGTFHDADAEGIHHLGFDRDGLAELARGAGFVDVETRTAMEIADDDDRHFPVFLLLGRNP